MASISSRIYVAGHRGMVGAAVARRFQALGYENLLLRTRSELDLTDAVAVRSFFSETRPELVVIAAARVGGIVANNSYPADFIRDNLQIQTNLIHNAFEHGAVRVLFLGSSCIYPRQAEQPIRETALLTGPLEPTNRAYAIAKIAGIEMCWSYNRQFKGQGRTSFLAAMPTNLYGPGDNYHPENSHVIPGLIRRFHEAKLSSVPTVTVWGSGAPRREFMHADDMAAACVHLLLLEDRQWAGLIADDRNDGEPPVVNIGVGEDISIAELASLIANVVGFKGSIAYDRSRPDGTMRKLMSIQKLSSIYRFTPRKLRAGLEQTYKIFQEHESCLANR
jgi:GDP-L-fucose synthase